MAVTIKDVAKRAGVSHTTVSRALRDHEALSRRTVDRIKRLAKEMGYVPSVMARGLRTNRSHLIGVVVPQLNNAPCSQMVQGIHDYLQERGFALLLTTIDQSKINIETILNQMNGRHVEGFIICAKTLGSTALKAVRHSMTPHIVIEHNKQDMLLSPYELGEQKAKMLISQLRGATLN